MGNQTINVPETTIKANTPEPKITTTLTVPLAFNRFPEASSRIIQFYQQFENIPDVPFQTEELSLI
ncbi:MAG: hypothetical protein ABEJ64_00515 [Candidatus Nanohaloarchaea archaeon]